MNIAAVEEMETKFPDSDVVLIESGGDNLTLTFSPALVDFFIYVIDVAAVIKSRVKTVPEFPIRIYWSLIKPIWLLMYMPIWK